jgi:hypothetical protein
MQSDEKVIEASRSQITQEKSNGFSFASIAAMTTGQIKQFYVALKLQVNKTERVLQLPQTIFGGNDLLSGGGTLSSGIGGGGGKRVSRSMDPTGGGGGGAGGEKDPEASHSRHNTALLSTNNSHNGLSAAEQSYLADMRLVGKDREGLRERVVLNNSRSPPHSHGAASPPSSHMRKLVVSTHHKPATHMQRVSGGVSSGGWVPNSSAAAAPGLQHQVSMAYTTMPNTPANAASANHSLLGHADSNAGSASGSGSATPALRSAASSAVELTQVASARAGPKTHLTVKTGNNIEQYESLQITLPSPSAAAAAAASSASTPHSAASMATPPSDTRSLMVAAAPGIAAGGSSPAADGSAGTAAELPSYVMAAEDGSSPAAGPSPQPSPQSSGRAVAGTAAAAGAVLINARAATKPSSRAVTAAQIVRASSES